MNDQLTRRKLNMIVWHLHKKGWQWQQFTTANKKCNIDSITPESRDWVNYEMEGFGSTTLESRNWVTFDEIESQGLGILVAPERRQWSAPNMVEMAPVYNSNSTTIPLDRRLIAKIPVHGSSSRRTWVTSLLDASRINCMYVKKFMLCSIWLLPTVVMQNQFDDVAS